MPSPRPGSAWRKHSDGGNNLLTSIVIPVLDNLDLTARCVASVQQHSADYELIVVDNGSGEATRGYLEALKAAHDNVRVIRNDFNLGFPVACNQGIAISHGDVVVLLNNDTEVQSGWLGSLLRPFWRRWVGLAGPMGTNVSGPQNVADEANWQRAEGRYAERLVGFCLAIRREVIEDLGGLDPRYGAGNFEDDDYCLRAQLIGYRLWLAGDCLVRHVGRATFLGAGIDIGDALAVNRKLFLHKWRGLGLSGSTISEMLASDRGQIRLADRHIPLPKVSYDLPSEKRPGPPPEILLSVLVSSLVERQGSRSTIVADLQAQAASKPVEILVLTDNARRTLGAKRNALKAIAAGRFLSFVDDDDAVAPDYVDAILAAVEANPATDCIVFDVLRRENGQDDRIVRYSAAYEHHSTHDAHYRKPNHKMVVRTELARRIDHPDITLWGDNAWGQALAPHIGSETRIDKTLYYYLDRSLPVALQPMRISLCMIVRNEEEFLADCLASVQGAVDEICVVDTGSTDRTVAIAEQFGAKIGHFEWCDDFAAARNASLDMATGDWILVLDADERLAASSIPEIRWAVQNPVAFGFVCQIESEQEGESIVTAVLRLFRNDPAIRYRGMLHEQPYKEGDMVGIDMAGIRIRHVGYEPDILVSRGKLERNLRIATAEAERRSDFHAQFNLARCYWELDDHRSAEVWAERAAASTNDPAEIIHAAGMQIAAVALRDDAHALNLATALRIRFPIPPVAFLQAKILVLLNRWSDAMLALDWRQDIDLARHLSCNFKPADLVTPGVSLREACDLYALCAAKTGRPNLALGYVSDAIRVIPIPDPVLWRKMADLYIRDGQWQEAGEALNRCLKLAPKDTQAWQMMVGICREIGRDDLAASAERNIAKLEAA